MTNAKTNTKTEVKRHAPKPTSATGAGTVATTKKATGTKAEQAAAPQAPLFVVNHLPPVRPGTHRAYAQQVILKLAKTKPKGFTLAELRAALIDNAAASTIEPPRGGWKAHNMPTWVVNKKQEWLVAKA